MVITEPCFFLWPGGNQPNQILLHKWRFRRRRRSLLLWENGPSTYLSRVCLEKKWIYVIRQGLTNYLIYYISNSFYVRRNVLYYYSASFFLISSKEDKRALQCKFFKDLLYLKDGQTHLILLDIKHNILQLMESSGLWCQAILLDALHLDIKRNQMSWPVIIVQDLFKFYIEEPSCPLAPN